MKIGFIKDVHGYRAPIHPESIDKYTIDIHLEKMLELEDIHLLAKKLRWVKLFQI